MCLNAISPTIRNTRKFQVYKVITKVNRSPYMPGFTWSPNKFYSIGKSLYRRKSFSATLGDSIHQGFHALVTLAEAKRLKRDLGAKYKIITLTIPVGAEMIFGKMGDIVSNKVRTTSLSSID